MAKMTVEQKKGLLTMGAIGAAGGLGYYIYNKYVKDKLKSAGLQSYDTPASGLTYLIAEETQGNDFIPPDVTPINPVNPIIPSGGGGIVPDMNFSFPSSSFGWEPQGAEPSSIIDSPANLPLNPKLDPKVTTESEIPEARNWPSFESLFGLGTTEQRFKSGWKSVTSPTQTFPTSREFFGAGQDKPLAPAATPLEYMATVGSPMGYAMYAGRKISNIIGSFFKPSVQTRKWDYSDPTIV